MQPPESRFAFSKAYIYLYAKQMDESRCKLRQFALEKKHTTHRICRDRKAQGKREKNARKMEEARGDAMHRGCSDQPVVYNKLSKKKKK
jgi:hypothetical protein